MLQNEMLSKDFEDMMAGWAEDGKIGGVQLAAATGEVLDEDNTMIEIILYGKSVFAKPCLAFGSLNVPSKEWLKEYSKQILVWVAFQNGNPAHPVYLGVQWNKGTVEGTNYPNIKSYKGINFSYVFDDTAKTFKLAGKDGSYLSVDAGNSIIEFNKSK